MYRIGHSYFGTEDITTTTVENEEILRVFAQEGDNHFSSYKLSFKPYTACHISINGLPFVYWEGNVVFNTDLHDLPIWSLKIKEIGTQYIIFGAN